jgi:hypothetical protein
MLAFHLSTDTWLHLVRILQTRNTFNLLDHQPITMLPHSELERHARTDGCIQVGALVELTNLDKNRCLNGMLGTIKSYDPITDRWGLTLRRKPPKECWLNNGTRKTGALAVKGTKIIVIHGPHPSEQEQVEALLRGSEQKFARGDPRVDSSWQTLSTYEQCAQLFLFSSDAVKRLHERLLLSTKAKKVSGDVARYKVMALALNPLLSRALSDSRLEGTEKAINHFERLLRLASEKNTRFQMLLRVLELKVAAADLCNPQGVQLYRSTEIDNKSIFNAISKFLLIYEPHTDCLLAGSNHHFASLLVRPWGELDKLMWKLCGDSEMAERLWVLPLHACDFFIGDGECYCGSDGLKHCHECKDLVCMDCWAYCDSCGENVCCSQCCFNTCGSCYDVVFCDDCSSSNLICCEDCSEAFCEDCNECDVCDGCHKTFCKECCNGGLDVCEVCDKTICNKCHNGQMQHCHRCAQILGVGSMA